MRTIRIDVKQEASLWFATSPDLRGLLVAEHTLEELDKHVPKAIEELHEAMGVTEPFEIVRNNQ